MCGQTLAWVTSENSTSNSNADILSRSSSPWLDPLFSATVSGNGVDCPCPWFHANSSLLTRLSAVQSPTACQLLFPANFLSRPLTTSGYGEISGPRILCLVSRQNRQRNRLLWRATHIVLHTFPSYPCHLFTINYNTIQQQAKKQKHLQAVTTEITRF